MQTRNYSWINDTITTQSLKWKSGLYVQDHEFLLEALGEHWNGGWGGGR